MSTPYNNYKIIFYVPTTEEHIEIISLIETGKIELLCFHTNLQVYQVHRG